MEELTSHNIVKGIDNEIFHILSQNHNFYLRNDKFGRFFNVYSCKDNSNRIRAVTIIQNAWRRYRDKKIYEALKKKLYELTSQDRSGKVKCCPKTSKIYPREGSVTSTLNLIPCWMTAISFGFNVNFPNSVVIFKVPI